MASTYSTNLKIELMATGENSGTWGTVTNTNMGTALEQAIIGLGNPDFIADANLTITLSNTNSAQAARALVLNVTSVFGSLTATRELIVPTSQKQYIVQNNTAGGQSITVKTSAGTGITVPNGRKAHLYVDGVNVIQMFDFVDINGGTIDGATIGATSASTGAFTSLTASGATTLNGAVALGDAAGDLITVPGTVNSNLLFTDNTYDIGATGATRPRNLFLAGAATIGGNLSVGGTLTLTGGVNLNGNVTVGDNSSDTLTINATITSNLLFTDNTYDIGASGATRPRNLFLAGNITAAGTQTLAGALTVDSTADSSSTTTGSIQTDGGVGIAKALFVGTTVTAATLSLTNALGTASGGTGLGGATPFTANGVVYASSTSALATGSALTFDGTNLGVGVTPTQTLNVKGIGLFEGTTQGNVIIQKTGTNGVSLFSDTAGTLGFYDQNGGATRMILTSSGLEIKQSQLIGYNSYTGIGTNGLAVAGIVGVGTASPQAPLQVRNASNASIAASSNLTNGTFSQLILNHGSTYFGASDRAYQLFSQTDGSSAKFAIQYWNGSTYSENLTLTAAGNLGVGTDSPGVKLHVLSSASEVARFATSGADMYLRFVNSFDTNGYIGYQNAAMTFWTANNLRATLDSAGRLLIGGTTTYDFNGQSNLVVSGTANNSTITIASTTDGYLAFADGTAGTEKYVGRISYYHALNQMDFWTNGTAKMYLDSSGNLGLGVTPSAWGSGYTALQINNGGLVTNVGGTFTALTANAYFDGSNYRYVSTAAASLYRQNAGVHDWQIAASGTAGNAISFTQAMTLDASGNLFLGRTSQINDGQLSIETLGSNNSLITTNWKNTQFLSKMYFSSDYYLGIRADAANREIALIANSGDATAKVAFYTGGAGTPTERARIDSSGNLLVGTTNPAYATDRLSVFPVSGNATGIGIAVGNFNTVGIGIYNGYTATGTATAVQFQDHNSVVRGSITVTTSATAYNTSSDYRLKNTIAPMTGALEKVALLKPCTYKWNADDSDGEGFIAHELAEVVPQCVTGEKDAVDADGKPKYQGIDTSFLVATLTAAIQEQQTLITALTARITALESSTLQ
jgi:hypothetical protein